MNKFVTRHPQKINSITAGFTLIEIMVTVIIVGVISSLALSNYFKVMEQSRCRNAQMNLITIHQAAIIKTTKTGTAAISGTDLAAINSQLKLNIRNDDFTFNYTSSASTYTVVATRNNSLAYQCWIVGPWSPTNTNPNCSNATYCPKVVE